MQEVGQVVLALCFPIVCLFLVLWLGYMEDTLQRDVRRSVREPHPPPILRVRDRSRTTVVVPAQASEVSRSAALSLGGSTNR